MTATGSDEMTAEALVLDEALTMSDLETLYETLKCVAATEQDASIDASAVTSVDTASLQLLLSFVRQLDDNGCRVNWCGVSDAFVKTADLLDLTRDLKCAA
ncbi:STAS domain-containing protein [Granulosicoccaceae sp. 1_MG-2023]|nr:STAS domain-containing protein [Granulosicoccaceae sp. 1_MG-2023]